MILGNRTLGLGVSNYGRPGSPSWGMGVCSGWALGGVAGGAAAARCEARKGPANHRLTARTF